MVEGALRLFGEFAKERMIDVGYFYQRDGRGESEDFFQNEEERVDKEE